MEAKNKYQTLANAEEQHLAEMSITATTTTSKTKKTTKKSVLKSTISQSIDENCITECAVEKVSTSKKTKSATLKKMESSTSADSIVGTSVVAIDNNQGEHIEMDTTINATNGAECNGNNKKIKTKTKKNKKGESDKQNISVKSSFNKFDKLQKRNLINVRSSDAGKAQEKFSINPQGEMESDCRLCAKPVYKMEEIKAEKSIFHKNCFRCHECNKQLKVDNYQSHEGVVYCLMHFKLLFAPKCVDETEPVKPSKPELIIRENQPVELPPDVVRASDKPDLGLEELSQLNVRSRFEVFEKAAQKTSDEQVKVERNNVPVQRSASILTKLAKLQASSHAGSRSSDESSSDENSNNGDDDLDLKRSKKRTQRDRPVGLGHAMNDIKSKFEKGHMMSKEERREERKQEIQNIRSRLFMGKQARIKEMYQQAVADSEQGITASSKMQDVEIGDGAARSMKERFEKGDIFKESHNEDDELQHQRTNGGILSEADVFESAMSKKSRSIFMELDANVAGEKNYMIPLTPSLSKPNILQKNQSAVFSRLNCEGEQENVVKYDEKPEDVKIETSEISSKFKFFETYRPTESKRKEFRMTPPRDGVVKLPTPEDTQTEDGESQSTRDTNILEKSQTTALMLNKFREMEQNKNGSIIQLGPRPLKCFTPPPDERRLYEDQDSDEASQDEEDDDVYEEEDEEEEFDQYHSSKMHMDDEALKEAQAAARAKQLRAKFEKWEANEVQRDQREGRIDMYSDEVSDQSNIESTKTIRERFENMKNSDKTLSGRPRYQVNRFV